MTGKFAFAERTPEAPAQNSLPNRAGSGPVELVQWNDPFSSFQISTPAMRPAQPVHSRCLTNALVNDANAARPASVSAGGMTAGLLRDRSPGAHAQAGALRAMGRIR